MTKYMVRKGHPIIDGTSHNVGDIVEMEEFDETLPVSWFEEVNDVQGVQKKNKPFAKNAKTANTNMEVSDNGSNDTSTE